MPGEEHLDHEDFSGKVLSEREAVLKGNDADALLAKADGLRRASFDREWLLFNSPSNLRQLSAESRLLALSSVERFYERTDERHDREQAEGDRRLVEAEAKAKEAAIPTLAQVFDAEVERRLKAGLIQQNTADTYRYEANAFGLETTTLSGRKALSDSQVHHLTTDSLTEWFGVFAARTTKFGRLPTSKTCENVLTHLRSVGKALRRSTEYHDHYRPFEVVDDLLEEVKNATRGSDGWRNRHRLTNNSVAKLIATCETDLEQGAVALMLAGFRPPSEPVAVRWEDLEYDKEGNLWWHVSSSAIELLGGELDMRTHTKTQEVDFRQLNISKRFVPWAEQLKGRSRYVLGDGDQPMRPSDFTELVETLISRAEIEGAGISTYSIRHTVADEVERILGRTVRDLVLHGRRDRTTGSLHYSHAQRDRRWAELTIDGKPYGEHMVWK
jgi:hypothetical protein